MRRSSMMVKIKISSRKWPRWAGKKLKFSPIKRAYRSRDVDAKGVGAPEEEKPPIPPRRR